MSDILRTVYLFDSDNIYTGELEVSSIRPSNSTPIAPPTRLLNYWLFVGDGWVEYVDTKIPVSFDAITGAGVIDSSDMSEVIVKTNVEITLDISIAAPDGIGVLVPLARKDSNTVIKAYGIVSGGMLSITIKIPSAGDWYCNEKLVNDISREMKFTLDEVVIISVV